MFHTVFARRPAVSSLPARSAALLALLAACATSAFAQETPVEAEPEVQTSAPAAVLTDAEARAELARTLPDTAPLADRLALLTRQRVAARVLGDQAARRQVLDQLVAIGKGQPDWPAWMLDAMNMQFTYGSQTRSIEMGEALVAESNLPPGVRANASSNLAWKYCQINDLRNCERLYAVAQRAFERLDASIGIDNLDYATGPAAADARRGAAQPRRSPTVASTRCATLPRSRAGARTASRAAVGADPKNGTYRGASTCTTTPPASWSTR